MDQPPSDITKRIAATVKSALRDQGITQQDASERTGIPFTTFKRYLRGTSPMDTSELEKVAALLGITVLDLFIAAEAAA
jgi:Helix-turn-helix.